MSIRKKDKKDKERKNSTTSSPTASTSTLKNEPSDGTAQPATRSWKKKLEENENQKTLKCVNLNFSY
jgi:hypothetical protein